MAKSPSILSISYDASLLQTRQWILETAGFHVTSALGFTEASKHCLVDAFDLVILGHSLPQLDKKALFDLVRTHNHSRILTLRRPGEPELAGAEYSLESLEGPNALLQCVNEALGLTDGGKKGT